MSEEKEMSFLGHIGELRGHLVRAAIAIFVGSLVIGFNINFIMDHIFFGPTRQDFITFRTINFFSRELTGENSINLPGTFAVQQKKLLEQFNVMMSVSIFGGMVLAFPYLIWELWRFIRPALHPRERKNSVFVINFVWILFMMGVMCGYFLILPLAINFGLVFNISSSITQLFDLTDYSALFLQVVLGMGLIFLFPIIVYFLTGIGIITPMFLKTYRKHATIVILVVAALITPADVFSMFAAAIPLLLLYEFSLFMSGRVYKRLLKEEALLNASLQKSANQ
ncbi:twin-arginine translocase subunit TatC [Frigoriflavimonas asaccharolytica]|uniref:Sec-independent protein translocase protein TatC n=1 Tax=Frigoriflavimonas asaccharolytica TaxID=2735899 RepID=A0A8J8G789_9FLAO|nr:twin-arginine translocase subunit TatC [Frigoriflavimonas asaccharolytica]NRS92788.1 sec-independent protein translocase protein TatC [Frigoriflavimonas asaccharolytica]